MSSVSPVTPYSGRLEVPGTLIADYILKAPASPRELYILLHGYGLTARSVHDKLAPRLPADAAVLSPNGPYPVPERADGKYRAGFGWYFYDFTRDEYLIDHANSVAMVSQAARQLGFESLPVRVIGFSQGGYLAPMLGRGLPRLRQVIGIAARYLDDELEGTPAFRYDSVHGEKDDIVDPVLSRRSHELMLSRGGKGTFRSDAESGHRLTPALVELALAALAEDGVKFP